MSPKERLGEEGTSDRVHAIFSDNAQFPYSNPIPGPLQTMSLGIEAIRRCSQVAGQTNTEKWG